MWFPSECGNSLAVTESLWCRYHDAAFVCRLVCKALRRNAKNHQFCVTVGVNCECHQTVRIYGSWSSTHHIKSRFPISGTVHTRDIHSLRFAYASPLFRSYTQCVCLCTQQIAERKACAKMTIPSGWCLNALLSCCRVQSQLVVRWVSTRFLPADEFESRHSVFGVCETFRHSDVTHEVWTPPNFN